MMSLRRGYGFGVGSVVAFAALLSHVQCTDSGSNGTNNLPEGGGDMTVVVRPPDPPTDLTIGSINPPRVAQAQSSTVLSIGGTGFKAGATVTVGGVTCDTPVVSQVNYTGTLISCMLPAQPKTCGPQTVVVTNPDGKSATDTMSFLRFPGAPAYAARAALTTAAQPDGVATGDLNADGKLDIVFGQRSTNTVAVRLGVGDGTFAAAVPYGSGGTAPVEVALADFNGDNKPDIAVAHLNGGGVSILLNTGTGTFGAAKAVAYVGAHGIATGDINGDGKMDVLATNTSTGAVGVFLGDGTGTLTAPIPSTVSVGQLPYDLAIGDLNKDGKLDFVATNFTDKTLSIRLGSGTGGFSTTATIATGAGPVGVALADLNRDGILDAVVANQTAGTASIYLGDGSGSFLNPTTLTTGSQVRQVIAVDLNRDGLLDLAFTNQGASSLGVYLGDGQGGFAGVTGATLFATGTTPYGIAAGDFNGDGNVDLVTTDFGSSSQSVFLATEQCK